LGSAIRKERRRHGKNQHWKKGKGALTLEDVGKAQMNLGKSQSWTRRSSEGSRRRGLRREGISSNPFLWSICLLIDDALMGVPCQAARVTRVQQLK